MVNPQGPWMILENSDRLAIELRRARQALLPARMSAWKQISRNPRIECWEQQVVTLPA